MVYTLVFAALLYILLFNLAEYIKKIGPLWKIIGFISANSYGIFLLQHKVIDYVNYSFRDVEIGYRSEILLLILITVLTVLFAVIADCVIEGFKHKFIGRQKND
jgi:hypothetical protein